MSGWFRCQIKFRLLSCACTEFTRIIIYYNYNLCANKINCVFNSFNASENGRAFDIFFFLKKVGVGKHIDKTSA